MQDDGLKNALKKCAVGFDTSEIVEEYTVEDGQLKLIKRKVTKRDVPPDIKAVKMILDGEQSKEFTEEELIAERNKLIEMLKEEKFD